MSTLEDGLHIDRLTARDERVAQLQDEVARLKAKIEELGDVIYDVSDRLSAALKVEPSTWTHAPKSLVDLATKLIADRDRERGLRHIAEWERDHFDCQGKDCPDERHYWILERWIEYGREQAGKDKNDGNGRMG
jgi:hypothetical protein